MKADLTRNTFDPNNHYARVLMQQGRVQLDADWNEQAAILLHYLRTLAADLIGPAGGPAYDCGFGVLKLPVNANNQTITTDFQIGLGHYYVDGILCEAGSTPIRFTPSSTTMNGVVINNVITVPTWSVDGTEFAANQYVFLYDNAPPNQAPAFPPTVMLITDAQAAKSQLTLQLPTDFSFGAPANSMLTRVITYLTQPDYPGAPALQTTGSMQLYLDVWERHLTYVEADSMREVALGGADTATRSKIVWQVKALPPTQTLPGEKVGARLTKQELNLFLQPPTNGKLKARAKQTSAQSNPCIISPNSSYQGPENQLYRVEIHRPGTAWDRTNTDAASTAATFKWSRENGSVVFPIVKGGDTNVIALESLGRDDRFGLSSGDWVEVQDDRSVLLNTPGTLLQVQSLDQASATATLVGTPTAGVGNTASFHPLLRRWDQKSGDPAEAGLTLGTDGAALIQEGVWLALEAGVEIYFEPLGAPSTDATNAYRSSDYWLIPARIATDDVEWPKLTDPSGSYVLDANGSTIPLAKAPDGIVHHYAPLAQVTVVAGQQFDVTSNLEVFEPLAKLM
ncbi:DUF6519 domain-containing protein [Granulicella sibirica]|uniref:Uncharacterized protein n=1 Tax=Granulicella sibirica TaxID=2479048 RepID=A0A4Q0T4K0_9BACT|nr:DUF6519 domain-containing protein [Granulicella sibirica]RXH56511.1 hypothetical protein GRAN_3368 [Granulicella sibirica]